MSVVAVLATALVALVVGRWYVAYRKFRRLELAFSGPPTLPILGNTLSFLGATKDDLGERFWRLVDNRTELTRLSLLGRLILVASDPDDIENIIRRKDTQDKSPFFYRFIEFFSRNGSVTLNGEAWKRHRKVLTPAFHKELLDKYQDFFDEESKNFVKRIQPGVAEDVLPNLKTNSARAFIRTALKSDVSGEVENFFPVLMDALEVVPSTVTTRAFLPWLWSDTIFGMTSFGRSVHSLVNSLHSFLHKYIQNLKVEIDNGRVNLSGKADENFIKERPTLLDILFQGTGDIVLPEKEIRDEVIIFTGAAIETTATSLGWTFKILSLRHDVQDRILQEVKEVIGQDDTIHPEHLSRLEYTERVIKESLRLYPGVPIIARSNNHQPADVNGETVPIGTVFLINILGAQRDPRHWEEPLKFDPDRFLPERSEGRHQYAYLPFSLGPRNCIGGRYAMAVMKTVLANVLPRYRVDPVDDGHTDPAAFPIAVDVASRMPGGVHVVFTPREPAAA